MLRGIQLMTGTVHYARYQPIAGLGASRQHLLPACGYNSRIGGGLRYSLEETNRDVTCKRCLASSPKPDPAKPAPAAKPPGLKPARKPTPTDRRIAALASLTARFTTAADIEAVGREAVAAEIEALLALGRSERWQGAVANWARAVREEESLLWAWQQFGIFAGYAA